MPTTPNPTHTVELLYEILCEDVRLEVGHKLSFMGVFHAIHVPTTPVPLPRLAVCHHWRGSGNYLSEVRLLAPGRQSTLAVAPPTPFTLPPHGAHTNVTFFLNLVFPNPGTYVLQTFLNAHLLRETLLPVTSSTFTPTDQPPNPLLN